MRSTPSRSPRQHRNCHRISLVAQLVCLLAVLSPAAVAVAARKQPKPKPAASKAGLLVLVVVDQARPDYLDRLRPHFRGGFKRLLAEGTSFTEAHHAHALTLTGPGHAAIVTGRHPSRSGIVGNAWYDRAADRDTYCVLDRSAPVFDPREPDEVESTSRRGRSPALMLTTALPDWIRAHSPGSKTYSLALKDRAAVLLGGKRPTGVYWYHWDSGAFTTSTYYEQEYPTWLLDVAKRHGPDAKFGSLWEAAPIAERVGTDFGLRALDTGVLDLGFPHGLGGLSFTADDDFYADFAQSPHMDAYLGRFARELIDREQLGQDEAIDYLAIGFSTLDYVGHRYGPNSREVLDVLLRLDVVLGELMTHLDRRLGKDGYVIALSSDHGVAPLPEHKTTGDPAERRLGKSDALCVQAVGRALDQKFGDQEQWLLQDLYLNYEAIGRRNLRRQDLEEEVARVLGACDAVDTVWTRTELEADGDVEPGSYRAMYLHSFHQQRSSDVIVQLRENHLRSRVSGTTHGSPYRYDTHVPFIVSQNGRSRVFGERVTTVDIAPTLAGLVGVAVPDDLDGVDRSDKIGR